MPDDPRAGHVHPDQTAEDEALGSHGTRNWNDIVAAASDLLDALPTVWQGSDEDPPDIAELRRLHEAATDAPWAWEMTGDKDNSWGVGLIIDDNDQPVVGRNEPGEGLLVEPICDGSGVPEDAELIATMRNALPALLDEMDSVRVLVGGRSAAPTRQEVTDAIAEAYVAGDGESLTAMSTLDAMVTAVMALLSRSAAEPPEDEIAALRSIVRRVAEGWSLRIDNMDVIPPFWENEDGEVDLTAAERAVLDGVAAEPPEDDTTERWRKLAGWWLSTSEAQRPAPGARDMDGGVAAEPNEETDSDG